MLEYISKIYLNVSCHRKIVIMGIPSYFSHIIKNYPNILRIFPKGTKEFEHLFMDCNSIIYDEVRKLHEEYISTASEFENEQFENRLVQCVINTIGNYIDHIQPSESVFIAFDGVAPFAKMNQQRTRRHKGLITQKINNVIGMNENQMKWTTSHITPGTSFMNKLSNRVSKAFGGLENHYGVKKIIISCSDKAGEGEHKLFQYVRSHKDVFQDGNMVIYGLDSDLIMLSLFHCEIFKNLYIFRETPEFGKGILSEEQCSMDYMYMHMHSLARAILHEMGCNEGQYFRLYDYMFMCFLLGNDFLPHFPSLNIRTMGIDVLLDTYKRIVGNNSQKMLVSKKKVLEWKWINQFLSALAKDEKNRLLEEYRIRDKMGSRVWKTNNVEDRDFMVQSVPIIYRFKEEYIMPTQSYWEHRYYESLFGKECGYKDVKDICENYLEGLEWVFKYYTQDCPNWKWTYRYHYPPLFKDLCQHLPTTKDVTFIDETNKTVPFSPYAQLAYVLPHQSHHLLPSHIENYLSEKASDFYVNINELHYEWAFCRYFWESHVLLPTIPVETLHLWQQNW